ncbi:MAG: hypothetical protein HXX10_00620 [Rhodoplanes sp.]|uniref:hypothetical protein n=1 Tax=Rhodoplanes sp. TaxID=1968906 RepID=UPI0017E112E8|nr:hypothetical protein [Rhodoplanes sp.]NVO12519.1 hypothetical protein [Rhodoplanes sp.]
MTISAVSASPTPNASGSRAGRTADSSFAAALAAAEDASSATASGSTTETTATPSTAASPAIVMSRRDGTVAYAIDPASVRRFAPPTREGVETMTADLAEELDTAFASAGLASEPPVSFTVDDTGIHAAGERDDLAAIDALVASDAHLRQSIRISHAITAQAYALEHTSPEDSYREVSDPQVAVERFVRMMEAQKATTMTFVYGGSGVSVTANGTAWPPSGT